MEGDVIRLRSISRVSKEIEYLSSLGVRKIFFVDSVFNYPLDYSLEIIDILAKHDLEWAAFFRANLLSRDYIKSLLKSKCRNVIIAAESGSQTMLDYLNSDNSIRSILNAIDFSSLLTKNKVVVVFTFILGLPKEKFKDTASTLMLIIRILLNRCFVHVNVFLNLLKVKLVKKGTK